MVQALVGLVVLTLVGPIVVLLPFRWIPPPTTAFMLEARAGLWIDEATDVRYQWVPREEIAPAMAVAAVAAEDQKFPRHHGFDVESIQKALEESDDRPRGASTISQQLVKNLYLWPGRSWIRKGVEAWLTLYLELLWPKRRILEVYLNVAEFGRGVYGVGEASRTFFGTSPAELSLWQASVLAAVLPSPRRSSVTRPSAYVQERASFIRGQVSRLGGVGYLDAIDWRE